MQERTFWRGHLTAAAMGQGPEGRLAFFGAADSPVLLPDRTLGSSGRGQTLALILREANGDILWARAFEPSSSSQVALGVTFVPNGDVVVFIQNLDSPVDFGGGVVFGGEAQGMQVPICARFDGTTGEHIWSTRVEIITRSWALRALRIATAPDGALWLTGNIINLSGQSPNDGSAAALKVNPNTGVVETIWRPWTHTYLTAYRMGWLSDGRAVLTASGNNTARLAVLDGEGRPTLTYIPEVMQGGHLELAIGPRDELVIASATPFLDALIIEKLSPQLERQWAWVNAVGADGVLMEPRVAVDSRGDVVIMGRMFGEVMVGEHTFKAQRSAVFVHKLDADGFPVWHKITSEVGDLYPTDITVRSDRTVVVGLWVPRSANEPATSTGHYVLELNP